MRKFFSITLLSVFIAAVATMFFACANQPSSNQNANGVTAEPTPDKVAIEAQLKAMESDWPRIVKERDGAAVRKLEADDIILVYPDGTDGSKDQDIKDIESGLLSGDPQEISDLTVNVLDNNSAVVRSRTTVKGDRYRISDGKCESIIHEFRSVDTFARRNGQWQIVASVTVPVRNPAPAAATPSVTPGASATPKPRPTVKASPAMKPSPARAASPVTKTSPP